MPRKGDKKEDSKVRNFRENGPHKRVERCAKKYMCGLRSYSVLQTKLPPAVGGSPPSNGPKKEAVDGLPPNPHPPPSLTSAPQPVPRIHVSRPKPVPLVILTTAPRPVSLLGYSYHLVLQCSWKDPSGQPERSQR